MLKNRKNVLKKFLPFALVLASVTMAPFLFRTYGIYWKTAFLVHILFSLFTSLFLIHKYINIKSLVFLKPSQKLKSSQRIMGLFAIIITLIIMIFPILFSVPYVKAILNGELTNYAGSCNVSRTSISGRSSYRLFIFDEKKVRSFKITYSRFKDLKGELLKKSSGFFARPSEYYRCKHFVSIEYIDTNNFITNFSIM